MNMPPTCEWDIGGPCVCRGTIWSILDKSTGKYHFACPNHMPAVMNPDHTFLIRRAEDFSVHGGHDLPRRSL